MLVATILIWILTVYAALGIVFAVTFVTIGIRQVDPEAENATWGFRLIILPGTAALWPLLAARWHRGSQDPPAEHNAHRDRATCL